MSPSVRKPPKKGAKPPQINKTVPSLYDKYVNKDFALKLVHDPHYLLPTCYLLFVFELLLNVVIIERVSYTEIDWRAYMQEVEGFLNGTMDYKELKGDTGPLVYPAGFVYIYSLLYYVTGRGTNVYLAQYIFLVFYLVQQLLTYRIFVKTAKLPPYALVISTVTSYRIHSIFVLRLFNDPVAVLLFYISLNLFISNHWLIGSFVYSLAVSVKMNILLYSPALLIAYLTNLTLVDTVINLAICGATQLILGAPFMIWGDPVSYLRGSFDLGRIFEHKWTVNYRFLSREVFENRTFHLGLLAAHIVLLVVFAPFFKRYLSSYAKLKNVTDDVRRQFKKEREDRRKEDVKLSGQEREFLREFEGQFKGPEIDDKKRFEGHMSKITGLLVLPFFVANLIGIACARSLHYQFYCWYFHSLVYLGFCTGFRRPVVFLILGVIEYCWNVYPSTDLSSGLLHLCHCVLLYGVYKSMKQ